ncbi:hypothetical protein GCM10010420_54730 [Streptomyces glaucosporus]|uniref:Integral membrane protein n=1 Tax=Streptomyces glaucosporus TaxID=284044 RepID=A0ABN3J0M6_9ACTN
MAGTGENTPAARRTLRAAYGRLVGEWCDLYAHRLVAVVAAVVSADTAGRTGGDGPEPAEGARRLAAHTARGPLTALRRPACGASRAGPGPPAGPGPSAEPSRPARPPPARLPARREGPYGPGSLYGTATSGGAGGAGGRMNVVRRITTAVAGTWTARGYLALCAALLLWVAFDTAFVQHEDASFAGVLPVLATAPASMLLMLVLPLEGMAFHLSACAVSALVNAAVLNWCVRAAGRSRSTIGAR